VKREDLVGGNQGSQQGAVASVAILVRAVIVELDGKSKKVFSGGLSRYLDLPSDRLVFADNEPRDAAFGIAQGLRGAALVKSEAVGQGTVDDLFQDTLRLIIE